MEVQSHSESRPRRTRWTALVAGGSVAAVVLLVVLALVLGRVLRSPEQAAADAAPPAASLITVPAESRVLSQAMVLRGRVVPGESQQLLPPASATGPSSVVTSVRVQVDQTVGEGRVLVVISGRPLLALRLPFPLYRNLAGGLTGPDVAEVQKALARLGYHAPVTSTYDQTTADAVGALFHDRGFTAEPGDPTASAGLPAAQAAVTAAQAALDAAVQAGEGVEAAQAALDAAQQALAEVTLRASPGLPLAAVTRLEAPGTVTAVPVKVGDVVAPDTVLVELDGGPAYVLLGASRDQVGLLSVGQEAQVTDDATGTTATATVSEVGTEPNADPMLGISGYPVKLAFTGEPLPPTATRTVRVDFAGSTDGAPVLAVPVTAIYSRPDGTTFVTVLRPDNHTQDVTVRTGQVAGGWVQVDPVDAGALVPGDLVVVGQGGQG